MLRQKIVLQSETMLDTGQIAPYEIQPFFRILHILLSTILINNIELLMFLPLLSGFQPVLCLTHTSKKYSFFKRYNLYFWKIYDLSG